MSFPVIRRRKFPQVGGNRRLTREGTPRVSAPERGYDYIWSKLSKRHKKKFPFCRFCEQEGREVQQVEVTDHIIPLVDRPDLRLTWGNLQSLCNHHHNGLKRALEDHARSTGGLDLLPVWCEHPNNRPDMRKMRSGR